jgi:hypothetical protein
MKEMIIQGKNVSVTKFGAVEGWKLLHKLVSILGPSIAEITDDHIAKGTQLLFDKMDENQMISLLQQLTSVCLIDGRKVDFASDCKDYLFTVELCKEVIEYNFKDFFLGVVSQVTGLLDK